MTTEQLLKKYENHIEEIARYAKSINFNFETDDYMEMLKGWLEKGRKFQVWAKENKKDFQGQIRRIAA